MYVTYLSLWTKIIFCKCYESYPTWAEINDEYYRIQLFPFEQKILMNKCALANEVTYVRILNFSIIINICICTFKLCKFYDTVFFVYEGMLHNQNVIKTLSTHAHKENWQFYTRTQWTWSHLSGSPTESLLPVIF